MLEQPLPTVSDEAKADFYFHHTVQAVLMAERNLGKLNLPEDVLANIRTTAEASTMLMFPNERKAEFLPAIKANYIAIIDALRAVGFVVRSGSKYENSHYLPGELNLPADQETAAKKLAARQLVQSQASPLITEGRFADVIPVLDNAVEIDNTNPGIFGLRSHMKRLSTDNDGAKADAHNALAIYDRRLATPEFPQDNLPIVQSGFNGDAAELCHMCLKDYARALAYYEAAIRIADEQDLPANVKRDLYFGRALMLAYLERIDDAKEQFVAAEKHLDPDDNVNACYHCLLSALLNYKGGDEAKSIQATFKLVSQLRPNAKLNPYTHGDYFQLVNKCKEAGLEISKQTPDTC